MVSGRRHPCGQDSGGRPGRRGGGTVIDCRRCGLTIEREDSVCPHCGAFTSSARSTFPCTPGVTGGTPRTAAEKRKGGIVGFGCGCLMSLVSLTIGFGLTAIPYVGWILAIGFIGAAFFWPFLGSWLGSLSGEE